MWWSLFAAAAVLWATDSLWLIGVMADDYRVGTVLDVGWLLAFALFAAAAWRPARLDVEVTEHAWSAVSVVAAAASFCLLIYGTQTRLPLLSVALAAGQS